MHDASRHRPAISRCLGLSSLPRFFFPFAKKINNMCDLRADLPSHRLPGSANPSIRPPVAVGAGENMSSMCVVDTDGYAQAGAGRQAYLQARVARSGPRRSEHVVHQSFFEYIM